MSEVKLIMPEPQWEIVRADRALNKHLGTGYTEYVRVWQDIEVDGDPLHIEEMHRLSSGVHPNDLREQLEKRIAEIIQWCRDTPDVKVAQPPESFTTALQSEQGYDDV